MKYQISLLATPEIEYVGETGALWDKGTIGTPPVTKNVNLGITMKCDFRNLGDSPSFLCEQQREILSVSKTVSKNRFFTPQSKNFPLYNEPSCSSPFSDNVNVNIC